MRGEGRLRARHPARGRGWGTGHGARPVPVCAAGVGCAGDREVLPPRVRRAVPSIAGRGREPGPRLRMVVWAGGKPSTIVATPELPARRGASQPCRRMSSVARGLIERARSLGHRHLPPVRRGMLELLSICTDALPALESDASPAEPDCPHRPRVAGVDPLRRIHRADLRARNSEIDGMLSLDGARAAARHTRRMGCRARRRRRSRGQPGGARSTSGPSRSFEHLRSSHAAARCRSESPRQKTRRAVPSTCLTLALATALLIDVQMRSRASIIPRHSASGTSTPRTARTHREHVLASTGLPIARRRHPARARPYPVAAVPRHYWDLPNAPPNLF